MIAKINTGSYVKGMVKYNQDKVKNDEASIIGISNIKDTKEKNIVAAISNSNDRNKNIAKPNLHISISFHKNDILNDEQMFTIANDYMEAMNFQDQPFVVYRHYDRPHPHFHIVSSQIDIHGKKISDKFNYYKNHKKVRAIEKKYNLVDATISKDFDETQDLKDSIHKYIEGEGEHSLSALLRRILSEVMDQKPDSLEKLDYYLKSYNVRRSENENGNYYSILNYEDFDNYEKTAVAITGAKLDNEYTLENLTKNIALIAEQKEALKRNMMGRAYSIINNIQTQNLKEFLTSFHKKGIDIEVKRSESNAELGSIYGFIFIDKKTGFQYSASELKIRTKKDVLNYITDDRSDLLSSSKSKDYQKIENRSSDTLKTNTVPLNDSSSIQDSIAQTLQSLLTHEQTNTANAKQVEDLYKKKKKRRRKRN